MPIAKAPLIQMVDLKSQYARLKNDIDIAIQECLDTSSFIGGKAVEKFENDLAKYLGIKHVISCANGTDALQIALMALDLKRGDEVIVPAFTYVATAEVIGLLGLIPVMVDVNEHDFNIDVHKLERKITPRTKAIVPVHLFGQSCDIDAIADICRPRGIKIIEDNAQSIGSEYISESNRAKTGTIGHIGCTSFFPSKNLGCYGDGGAIFTNDRNLADKIRMIAHHGQSKKYYHDIIGVNSRLDAIQASILNVKLRELDDFISRRQMVASFYDQKISGINDLHIPSRKSNTNHVFHQYTLRIKSNRRDELKKHLAEIGIPSMIYYPIPLYKQNAYKSYYDGPPLRVTEMLCKQVLSLPIHTEMTEDQLQYICENVIDYFD